MKRRDFLKAALLGSAGCALGSRKEGTAMSIPRRPYKAGVKLSVIGFGGIVVCGLEQKDANAIVAEAVERGVNYFDVAPSYFKGEAEEKLGAALEPYRSQAFLACKTTRRDAKGAQEELEQSLKRLRTDHFDLYQFHGITKMEDVDAIFGAGGAAETFVKAREAGRTRFIGFSAHSVQAAVAMMERFPFDSVLFPINFVCYAQGNLGPQVVQKAKEKGVARLALKALAHTPWPEGAEKKYRKCWYQPVDDPVLARQALRFALSEDITAAIPPGDERIFRMALALAADFQPLTPAERAQLLAGTKDLRPIFKA